MQYIWLKTEFCYFKVYAVYECCMPLPCVSNTDHMGVYQIPYTLGECPGTPVFSMADPNDQRPNLQAIDYFTSN